MYHTAYITAGYINNMLALWPVSIENAANGSEKPEFLGDHVQHYWLRDSDRSCGTSDAFHARLHVAAQPHSSYIDDIPAMVRGETFYWDNGPDVFSGYGYGELFGFKGTWKVGYDSRDSRIFYVFSLALVYDAEGATVVDDGRPHTYKELRGMWSGGYRNSSSLDYATFITTIYGTNPLDVIRRGVDEWGWTPQAAYWRPNGRPICYPTDYWSAGEGEYQFKHNELDAYYGYEELGALPNLYRNGFACAATEAAKNLPNTSANGVANVIELAEGIISVGRMFMGDFSGVTDLANPKNAWLAYRYGYSTTKADIVEYASLISRLEVLAKSDHIRVGGTFARDDLQFKATIEFATEDVIPSDVKGVMKQFNLELTAYNAWDLVPYSFVADWFIDIGGMLERLELKDRLFSAVPVDSWYSCRSAYRTDKGLKQDVYFRLGGLSTTVLGTPWWDDYDPSRKTKIFRFIDGVALFG